ncbi:hypothetical protein B0H65DRAFT_428862 [Neurospora tetraspora]|uniref:Uncharacterized protein n=1 Tax=Neurospora tetraspora TaxID=94610 RepID=A0AAE0JDE1_9PEZI|nr:hypothetical protein B0H65DRAFT_428862 [Neurospora tetraspora]
MIDNQESLTRPINSAGFHGPVSFRWRVTGYFTPGLLDGHLEKLTRATQKWLNTCHWPAKELEYGSTRVESMPLCSREERNKAPLDKNGRAYFAMTVQITVHLNRGSTFIPQNVVDLQESLFDCLFPQFGDNHAIMGSGFRYHLPIGGVEGANQIFSSLERCFTDELPKALVGAFMKTGIAAHNQIPERFPASAIIAFVEEVVLKYKHGSTESAEKLSNVPNRPDAVQTIVHDLLDTYLTSFEAFKHTVAAAHNEGTVPKTIKNVVTNAEIMLSSLHRLVINIEHHVGKTVPGSNSRFFLKRWINNYFRSAEPPTICLDTDITGFDVDRCKRTLRTKLCRYEAASVPIIGAVRLLDPDLRKEFKQVVDSTANTPDKVDLLRLYGGVWQGMPNFTREQLLETIDSYMQPFEDIHRKLVDHLNVINNEIGRSIDLTSRDLWWHSTDVKEKQCFDSDSLY